MMKKAMSGVYLQQSPRSASTQNGGGLGAGRRRGRQGSLAGNDCSAVQRQRTPVADIGGGNLRC